MAKKRNQAAADAATMRYQAMQRAVEAGQQVAPQTTATAAPGTAPVSTTGLASDAATRNLVAIQQAVEAGTLTYFSPPTPLQRQMGARAAEAAAVNLISGGEIPATADPTTFIEETITAARTAGVTGAATFQVRPVVTTATTTAPGPKEPAPEDVILNIAIQKLSQYNLRGVADSLKKAREAYPELELTDLLFLVENDDRYNAPFKERFKANELRLKQGLPKISAADYLALEQGYRKIFTTYNLPMFSNQNQYDKFIAGDIDVADLSDRVVMAYDRVVTDTSTRNAFRQFYGTLTDADIVSALLDPEQQIPALERKVVAAEVGGQALRQGLATGLTSMEAMVTPEGRQVTGYTNVKRGTLGADVLAGEGVTEQTAAAGYERVAEQLPTAEKLSAIYGGRAEQVGQRELEQAELLGLESAKRKRRQLVGMEEAQFSGQAGTMRTSLGRRGRSGTF